MSANEYDKQESPGAQLLEQERVAFYTLGCRLNQAETATIQRRFEAAGGYEVVDIADPADLVVINTCTVTANGDADTRKIVNKVTRANPETQIALVGCQAQMQAETLAELDNVRWVVGNARKMDLPRIVNEDPAPPEPRLVMDEIPREPFTQPVAGIDPKHHRANLKIQDGCDFFCLFCEIPYARGRARSRVYDDMLREARELSAAGHRELVLTGVNIGCYEHEGRDFLAVIDGLLAEPSVERVRISSIEPTTIPAALLERFTPDGRLCRHLHIPLQAGSDPVLQKMNRKYTTAEFAAFLLQAHAAVPDICLGTDVIVGYPSETDALFDESVDYLRELPFAYFHVFSYSERTQARSRRILRDQIVPPPVIAERSRVLRELSDRKRRVYHERFLGQTVPVLFEQERDGIWTGTTDTYIRVAAPSELNLENQILPVRLEEAGAKRMSGVLV